MCTGVGRDDDQLHLMLTGSVLHGYIYDHQMDRRTIVALNLICVCVCVCACACWRGYCAPKRAEFEIHCKHKEGASLQLFYFLLFYTRIGYIVFPPCPLLPFL